MMLRTAAVLYAIGTSLAAELSGGHQHPSVDRGKLYREFGFPS
jgi:hypothetical protein